MPGNRWGTDQVPWRPAALNVGGFVALLWALEILDTLLGNRLDEYGVRPRTDEGLLGILFAPLLHSGFGHLIANTLPLLVLGYLVALSGIRAFWIVTAIVWLVGGAGTWLVAPSYQTHLGASVIVFGWLLFLILRGIFTRSVWQILIGVGVLVVYGGALFGVLPGQAGISWQGHLFGAIGGGLAAALPQARGDRERSRSS